MGEIGESVRCGCGEHKGLGELPVESVAGEERIQGTKQSLGDIRFAGLGFGQFGVSFFMGALEL